MTKLLLISLKESTPDYFCSNSSGAFCARALSNRQTDVQTRETTGNQYRTGGTGGLSQPLLRYPDGQWRFGANVVVMQCPRARVSGAKSHRHTDTHARVLRRFLIGREH